MSNLPERKAAAPRRRLSREKRRQQLIGMAWRLVRDRGTDALTLGYLAEVSGVSKPVVYSHFKTREALLVALHFEFENRQNSFFDAAIAAGGNTLEDRAGTIAETYVACMLEKGKEIPGVILALASSPELAKVRRDSEIIFIDKCRELLQPFVGSRGLNIEGLWGVLGVAQALTREMSAGHFTPEEVQKEIYNIILAVIRRS